MRLLFFAATAAEWRAACPQWQGALPEQQLLDVTDKAGRPHLLCVTGVGPVNAGIAAGMCLAHLRPGADDSTSRHAQYRVDAAVSLGVAGTFDLARAPLGSAWRVTREICPEYGLATDSDVDARALGFAQWTREATCSTPQTAAAQSPQAVWDSLDLPMPHGLWERLPEALRRLPAAASLSVAGVTADTARAARLHARHKALLENMEGFALALACARHGLPLLELRTVSNAVGPRVPELRNFPKALSALQPLLHNLLTLV